MHNSGIKEVLSSHAKQAPDEQPSRGLFEVDETTERFSHVQLLPGLELLPATYQFINTELLAPKLFENQLKVALEHCREDYDYILLDAQAGADVYASIAMRRDISDVVVLVSEYDPVSAAGIERLKGLMRDDLTYARTWVLLNKVLPEFAKSFSDFLEVARYISPIPWDADVVRAYARRRLALDTEAGNPFTLAIIQTVRGLLGDEIDSDIKEWMETRADAIRRPVEKQYDDLERELKAIVGSTSGVQLALAQRQLVRNLAAAVLVSVVTFGLSSVIRMRGFDLSGLGFTGTVMYITLFVGVLVFLFAIRDAFLVREPVELLLERSKLERRREVLETSLRKLETLRSADPESLLRIRDSI